MNLHPNDVATIMGALGVIALLGRGIIDLFREKNVTKAYNDLVRGIVSNRDLTTSLSGRYAALPDKKWADTALTLIDELTKLTPDQADDVLRDWTAQIRHNTISPVTGQPIK